MRAVWFVFLKRKAAYEVLIRDWSSDVCASDLMDCSENRRHCPQTTRLLKQIPGASTAFFSILAPGKKMPPHRGAYNGILRCHLGLIVPEPAEHVAIREIGRAHV